MSKRLEILEASLIKKRNALNEAFDAHFADVKRANGQPLNDKRNGQATLRRWDRQSDGLRRREAEIAKTERAIEREKGKISDVEAALSEMPKPILDLVSSGTLVQWRKHPNTFFVKGVDKARIQFKSGKLVHKFVGSIGTQDEYAIFRDTFNALRREIDNLLTADGVQS